MKNEKEKQNGQKVTCTKCNGKGIIGGRTCSKCHGTGQVELLLG